MTRVIGITLGEPCGIGPEIVVRTLAKGIPAQTEILLYGSSRLLEKTARDLDIGQFWKSGPIRLIPVGPDSFEDKKLRAESTLFPIDRASKDALSGKIHAMVTSPIDKSIVRTLLPNFTGHTGYLAQLANVKKTLMLLDNTEIRVLLVTEHIPLREVSKVFTVRELETAIDVAAKAFREWFGRDDLRVAIVGLNPHAGEIVDNPEEETVIRPVIEKLKKPGLHIQGPFAADSFFSIARNQNWDFIVSPYHDQGLIAAKYPGLDKVVNITLGLPYLRVSPGHGVAYDLYGKGTADTRSFERALRIAISGKLP